MRNVCVVTPWINHPELAGEYLEAVRGADEVVVIDNGGAPADELRAAGVVVLNPHESLGFAGSNNLGLALASRTADVVVFLNNDVRGDPSWLDLVREQVDHGALCGPQVGTQTLRGVAIPYVVGWCVAATRETWDRVGGWDEEHFPRPYWEDVDLSLRAIRAGIELQRAPWRIEHIGGISTSTTPGSWDGYNDQRARIEEQLAGILA